MLIASLWIWSPFHVFSWDCRRIHKIPLLNLTFLDVRFGLHLFNLSILHKDTNIIDLLQTVRSHLWTALFVHNVLKTRCRCHCSCSGSVLLGHSSYAPAPPQIITRYLDSIDLVVVLQIPVLLLIPSSTWYKTLFNSLILKSILLFYRVPRPSHYLKSLNFVGLHSKETCLINVQTNPRTYNN